MPNTKIKEVYPLYYDLMAKHIFGFNTRAYILQDLLEGMFNLESGELKDIEILNSVHLDKETIKNKDFETDIVARLKNGEIVNVEFYLRYDKSSEIKSFMYITRQFSNYLKKGEDYILAKKISQINFIKEDNVHKKSKELVNKYTVINENDKEDKILPELFQVYIVDVDKNTKKEYNGNERFLRWIKFIGAETPEEMEEIIRGNKIMEETYEEMKRFSNEEWVSGYFSKDRLTRSQILEAHMDGQNEGIELGENSSKLEIAKNMLNEDIKEETIAKVTGLSLEEVLKLKEEID